MPKINSLSPKIRKRTHRGSISYEVDLGFQDGKRIRKSFKIKSQATTYAAAWKNRWENEGFAAFGLTDDMRQDAKRAFDIIRAEDSQLTLEHVAREFIKIYKQRNISPTISDLKDQYIQSRIQLGRRNRTILDLKSRLNAFCTEFGNLKVPDLTEGMVAEYVSKDPKAKPQSIHNQLVKIGQLLNFGIKRGYIEKNVAENIDRPRIARKEAGIFTVEEVERILRSADELNITAPLVLGFFGGLRQSEIQQLYWTDISLEKGTITISADIAKGHSRRIVDMEPVLKSWLEPIKQNIGKVVQLSYRRKFEALKKAALKGNWVHNGARHCYGSYHYAQFKDSIRTMQQMGHKTTDLLHDHYKALVGTTEAAAYWSLFRDNVLNSKAA